VDGLPCKTPQQRVNFLRHTCGSFQFEGCTYKRDSPVTNIHPNIKSTRFLNSGTMSAVIPDAVKVVVKYCSS
jgi:hypothetical protein